MNNLEQVEAIDIAKHIAFKQGLRSTEAKAILDEIFFQIERHLKDGKQVHIKGFALFTPRKVTLHGKTYTHYKLTTPNPYFKKRFNCENANDDHRKLLA